MRIQKVKTCNPRGNPVIVESLFRETTRNGKHTLRIVILALTHNLLMIASSHSFGSSTLKSIRDDDHILEIRSLHPLNSLKFSIFKKSTRHTLKLCFLNKYDRYFELEKSRGTDMLWAIWCKEVLEMGQTSNKRKTDMPLNKSTSRDLNIFSKQWKPQKFIWHDKYLYLGSKREVEDSSRPSPVPGLGPPENIKLSYLKPQYFGCWDQSEHWVQCESSKLLN